MPSRASAPARDGPPFVGKQDQRWIVGAAMVESGTRRIVDGLLDLCRIEAGIQADCLGTPPRLRAFQA